MNVHEIEPAVRAGAELVLSVNASNRDGRTRLGLRGGRRPRRSAGARRARRNGRTAGRSSRAAANRSDLGTDRLWLRCQPGRYLDVRRRYPDAEMMMGIGNLTELTDADSAAINVLLLGFCQELAIHSVLTTQVINWARSSVRECDLARRLVHYAQRHHVLPKRLEPRLVVLRDAEAPTYGDEAFERMAREIKDHNYRIFAEDGQLHVVSAGLHQSDADPFALFEQLLRRGARSAGRRARVLPRLRDGQGAHRAHARQRLSPGRAARLGVLDPRRTIPPAGSRAEATANRRPRHSAPDRRAFHLSEATTNSIDSPAGDGCLVEPCDPHLDLEAAFVRLARWPHCVFFDSARRDPALGRYSFLAADPFDYLEVPADGSDALSATRTAPGPICHVNGCGSTSLSRRCRGTLEL